MLHTKPNKILKRTHTIDDEMNGLKSFKKGRINLAIIYNKEYIETLFNKYVKTSAILKFLSVFIKMEPRPWNKTLLNTIYLAKNKYNLKKLNLFVKKSNKPAINIFKRTNFKMSKQKKLKVIIIWY